MKKQIKTELQLEKLKAKDKPYDIKVAYSAGLYVRVNKSGSRSFRWDRGKGHSPRYITYGQFPVLSLKQARDLQEKTRQQYIDGAIGNVAANAPKTIRELAEAFYADRIVPHRKRPDNVRLILDSDILPMIGNKKLVAINTLVVRQVVKKVVDRGAPVQAGKVLAIMKQLLGFGIAIGVLENNAAQALKKIDLGITDNQRDRVLAPAEIKIFWDILGIVPRLSIQTKAALQLLLLLGLRSGELRLSKWADVDLVNKVLTIPVINQKMSLAQSKKARPFQVPISKTAVILFKQLKLLDLIWVFPGKVKDKPISDKSLGRAVRRILKYTDKKGNKLCPVEQFTPHDLRRTFRSNLSKLGVQPHIAERCLNHSLGRIIDTYDHHDYFDERKQALDLWDNSLQKIIAGANI